MTLAEIIVLIIGVILFAASFFIKGKSETGTLDPVSEASLKKIVRSELDREMGNYKSEIEDVIEESTQDNKDKMERFMDRITNEKMLAVSEYSDGVLERIHKNHEEAVFLYDMLNNKHSQVKNTAAEISAIEKNVKVLSEQNAKIEEKIKLEISGMERSIKPEKVTQPEIQDTGKETVSRHTPESSAKVRKESKAREITEFKPIEVPKVVIPIEEPLEMGKVVVGTAGDGGGNVPTGQESSGNIQPFNIGDDNVRLMFDSEGGDANNNKEKIIALHKGGKSNMAIAKELGLGIGEVKLVLDLYRA